MKLNKYSLGILVLILGISVFLNDDVASFAKPVNRNGFVDVHAHLNGTYFSGGSIAHLQGIGRRGRGSLIIDFAAAADNLIEQMDTYGVQKALLLPPPHKASDKQQKGKASYKELLAVIKKHPDRLFLIGGGAVLNPYIYKYKPSQVTPAVKQQFTRMRKTWLN